MGYIADGKSCAISRSDRRTGNIAGALDPTLAAQDVFHAIKFQQAGAGFHVGATHSCLHFFEVDIESM